MSLEVFISYSRVDLAFIVAFDDFLGKLGIATWFDKKSLRPGKKWEDVIQDEIRNSQVFLTCMSKAGMDKRGYFHVEQNLAAQAALRIPPEQLFIMPVVLGECDVPRQLRPYHVVNLVEPGAIEMLLLSLAEALDRPIKSHPGQVTTLRELLLEHLGAEGASNKEFEDRFMRTEDISFQDSAGLVERIANSSDASRLALLLKLRGLSFISFAERVTLPASTTILANTTSSSQFAIAGQVGGSATVTAAATGFQNGTLAVNVRPVLPPPPSVSSITPMSGIVGTLVRVGGTGFAQNHIISFGNRSVATTFVIATELQFRVPQRSVGNHNVMVANVIGPQSFALTAAVPIAAPSPISLLYGSNVTLSVTLPLAAPPGGVDLIVTAMPPAGVIQLAGRGSLNYSQGRLDSTVVITPQDVGSGTITVSGDDYTTASVPFTVSLGNPQCGARAGTGFQRGVELVNPPG